MKPVAQRHDSDCAAASLAAILELPITEVPDFWNLSSDGYSMHERIRRWLAGRGYHWLYTKVTPRQLKPFREEPRRAGHSFPPRGYWIAHMATVEALRDRDPTHLVVMKDRRAAFNPGGGLPELHAPDYWLIGFYVLVPLDPAAK